MTLVSKHRLKIKNNKASLEKILPVLIQSNSSSNFYYIDFEIIALARAETQIKNNKSFLQKFSKEFSKMNNEIAYSGDVNLILNQTKPAEIDLNNKIQVLALKF
ncbi:hypothetical protein BpHYR1_003342 [Brachionus plicatilis]|uniref:Uncharacterized protein n=1 Tax=Brachionus plicatilis TaxID=10195 RepID=A0A3M7R8U2_BRAPC|nr:hypothetical protein BpHYR1_003342 [Brachionus plicatilis]